MSQYNLIPSVIDRIGELGLNNVTVVEDYTMPSVARPILKTVISVGATDFSMVPVSRFSHKVTTDLRLTFLFPCGLGDADISETVFRVSAGFTGRRFGLYFVEKIDATSPVFNADLYGVKLELILRMKIIGSVKDPSVPAANEEFRLGGILFDRFPERFVESRISNEELGMAYTCRVFTLEGESALDATATFWKALHTLMKSNEVLEISLPRSSETVKVRPTSIVTEGDTCGYGFKYKLTFTEDL